MIKNDENVIEVKNVKKVYRMGHERILAVDNVSFTIKKGEFCCLYGASGSGKSTLLNLMAGIEKVSAGQIIIKGRNIHRMSEKGLAQFRQNSLGFVFQSYNLMNSMTALENVELPLIFKHLPQKKRKKMAREMLTKVGLGKRLRHKPREMSGGQQQRVGIARAFVGNPEIVFADEPTGNLDSKTSKEVMDLIKGMAQANKLTIVMVTHDRGLAEYADRIIHIFDGKIEDIEIVNKEKELTIDEIKTCGIAGEEHNAEETMTEGSEAEKIKPEGLEAEVIKSEGPEAEVIKSEGSEAEVIKSEGSEAEGIKSEGSETEGIKSGGSDAEKIKLGGSDAEEIISEGSEAEGSESGGFKTKEIKAAELESAVSEVELNQAKLISKEMLKEDIHNNKTEQPDRKSKGR